MARKKTPKFRVRTKAELSSRLRDIRQELYGPRGGPELARQLGISPRTWYNYERGVTVPAEILLGFLGQTGVNPAWLLRGEEPRYRKQLQEEVLARLSAVQVIRRGLDQLEQRIPHVRLVERESLAEPGSPLFVSVPMVPLGGLADPSVRPAESEGQILAYQDWIPHPRETVAVCLEDDVMAPVLPAGSIVAVDRAIRDPKRLHGCLVAAAPEGQPVIRWLDVTRRHVIFRPNRVSDENPLVPVTWSGKGTATIIGQVVWSWSSLAGCCVSNGQVPQHGGK